MGQQQRPRLAALAHLRVGGGEAVAGADDVADAGEQVGFHEQQPAVRADRRVDDHEQGVAEGLQLRPAVLFQCVGNGQFMQVELLLQVQQLLASGFLQADPDEMILLAGPAVAVLQGNIGDLLALGVHG
ncbi:hypothetical protein D9M71_224560 [compost metagenome]